MIRVYPSRIRGPHIAPMHTEYVHGLTIEQWLFQNMPGFEYRDDPPITVLVNECEIPQTDWAALRITARDEVVIMPPPPRGYSLIIGAIVGLVSVTAALVFKPSVPNQVNQSTESGQGLLEVSASANKVKLNDVIPEVAGRVRRYPDYLVAPHRRFANDHKTQTLQMIVAVGKGSYDFEEYMMGDTPFSTLGQNVSYTVYPPGADLSDDANRLNWYNAPEVGPAVGASGIPMQSTHDAQESWDGTLTFSGDTITSAVSDLPSGWATGLIVYMEIPEPVTITAGATGQPDVITGAFRWFGLQNPGQVFTIIEYIDYLFRIITFEAGTTVDNDVVTLERTTNLVDWEPWTDAPIGNHTFTLYLSGTDYVVTDILDNGFTFNMRKDGTPVSNWLGFPTVTTANATVTTEDAADTGLWSTPFAACPAGEVCTNVEVDIFAPSGFLEMGETSGNIYTIEETIEIRYRPIGTANWQGTFRHTIEGNSRDQMGWSFREVLPSAMRPEISVRRLHAQSTSVYVTDDLEFYGLRSLLTSKNSYPGITVLSVMMEGSDQIAAQTDNQINVICTRKLPTMTGPGEWTSAQATRDISAWVRYVALDAGYTDADIDQDELWRLHNIWTDRGDNFDFIEADDSTVKDVLARVLRVGYSELTVAAGQLRPVRDEARTALQNSHSAQAFTDELKISFEMPKRDDIDGVDVEYTDNETWTSVPLECRLPGVPGTRIKSVRLEGITDMTKAYQAGMRHLRTLMYRRKSLSFGTELSALNSEYMNYDAVISDIPGQGQSMLQEAHDDATRTITVSEKPDWTTAPTGNRVVAWRLYSGRVIGPFPATKGATDFEIVVGGTSNLPSINTHQEPVHVYFGHASHWVHEVLIQNITPDSPFHCSVEAVGYDDRVYLSDDAVVPASVIQKAQPGRWHAGLVTIPYIDDLTDPANDESGDDPARTSGSS